MLPPKVARMMINLGCQTSDIRHQTSEIRILDPFCGVGTVLAEALIIGKEVIGSDIDPKQVERTRKNLAWLGKKIPLIVSDARKIFEKVPPVEAIVTETDLGPKASLNQLYFDCFKHWQNKVKTVVIALPSLNVIDKLKSIGYTLVGGPFEYARPQAKVKRNIVVLKYGTH